MALGKKKYRAVKLKIDYQRDIYGVVILADADAKIIKMSPQKRILCHMSHWKTYCHVRIIAVN